jgi:hypothetical protein
MITGDIATRKFIKFPFSATLLYVPCALLKNCNGNIPPDLDKVTIDGQIDYNKYYKLYEKRLLPPFIYSNTVAATKYKKAFITVPDFGCGQFAGKFKGQLGSLLKDALKDFLEKHGKRFSQIQAVYYDPYSECDNERFEINGISFLVRPFTKGNENKPQLCKPQIYEEYQDDFRDCSLFSLVAWDHVSWPGNDFYIGIRSKDSGIKAAATNLMEVVTGVKGYYYVNNNTYKPEERYVCWNTVVMQNEIKLQVKDNLMVVSV